ncbi:PAS domain S-box protein, partial [bacterium]|nr:PAS domain S-box protein [bacterium]
MRKEKTILHSEKYLNSIVANVPDVIYRLDKDSNITFINDAVEKYGYTAEELINKNILDFVHPEDRDKTIYRINERRTGNRSTKALEVRLLTKNRTAVPFEVKSNVVRTSKRLLISAEGIYNSKQPVTDTFIGTQGIARDISERIKVEEEKRNLEVQLFQVQKMESIGRLAGAIAHDFNNTLTSILGYAELLYMQAKDSKEVDIQMLKVIINSSEKAVDLTKQLLNFTRANKGNLITLNINDVIKEVIEVSGKIFEKTIKVKYDFDKNISPIIADKNQMDQILTNLVINAKDAMPISGEIIFKTENVKNNEDLIKKYPEFNNGNYVKVSVSDNGTGMPDEIKNHIFEPFFTTKVEGKGTGLGLASVYAIIKNHNGYIDCISEEGAGTTFVIYLPASKKQIVSEEIEEKVFKGRETIFVIDDEDSVRALIANQLQ